MYKLPSYVVGLLLTCAVAAYGPYQDLVMSGGKGLGWMVLGAIAAFFFGVYAVLIFPRDLDHRHHLLNYRKSAFHALG
jgi:hypothetical protein